MPCVFCIAMFITGATAITTAAVESIMKKLAKASETPVRKVADTSSVAKFELEMKAGRKETPVMVTIFKESKRVRIQILSHDLNRIEAEKIENQIADLLDLKILDRSHLDKGAKVRESFEHAPDARSTGELPGRERPPPVPGR